MVSAAKMGIVDPTEVGWFFPKDAPGNKPSGYLP